MRAMSILYENLDDPGVRAAMLQELARDIADDSWYRSARLTDAGVQAWPQLLQAAITSHDDDWLANELQRQGLIRTHEERRKPKGGTTLAAVPHTAPETMAEGEFNRFYARGLCVVVGEGEVEVYRGKAVANPRPESETKVGERIPAAALLVDLRSSKGVEPALGLPPGPNSGLTVRRPK